MLILKLFLQQILYLNFHYCSSWTLPAGEFTTRWWEKKTFSVMNHYNFYFFCTQSALQTFTEQVISGIEFQIGQNNRYEIYPDMNFISPPNV